MSNPQHSKKISWVKKSNELWGILFVLNESEFWRVL